jgi:L-lactate dehydrogenase complex protein LldG
MSSRDTVLGRVRAALADVPRDEEPNDVDVPRDYNRGTGDDHHRVLDQFVEHVRDYGAGVRRARPVELADTVRQVVRAHGVHTMAVAPGFPEHLVSQAGVVVMRDETPMSPASLDRADGVATTAAAAIAETGTIALVSGSGMGRRALSLVPDVHVCVVREDQVVATLPQAMDVLATNGDRPITLISGGSATSDIELVRVEGVHGPRTLEVILLADA